MERLNKNQGEFCCTATYMEFDEFARKKKKSNSLCLTCYLHPVPSGTGEKSLLSTALILI